MFDTGLPPSHFVATTSGSDAVWPPVVLRVDEAVHASVHDNAQMDACNSNLGTSQDILVTTMSDHHVCSLQSLQDLVW